MGLARSFLFYENGYFGVLATLLRRTLHDKGNNHFNKLPIVIYKFNMSRNVESVDIREVWNSGVSKFLEELLITNWSKIGVTTEIEARLGKMGDHGFLSGVSVETFYQIKDYMSSKSYWTDRDGKNAKPQEVDEYVFLFESNYRVVLRKDGGQFFPVEVIKKSMREKRTFCFGDHIHCLRISAADEIPLSDQERGTYINKAINYMLGRCVPPNPQIELIRHRQRTSFNFHNEYIVDLTATQSGESLQEVGESDTIYEVECEMGIPRHCLNHQLSIFLNAILARLLGQQSDITMPPKKSKFSLEVIKLVSEQNLNQFQINNDIELLTSEGYDDGLIKWCKQHNSDGRAILPRHLAKQLQWSIAHPPFMYNLQNIPWKPFEHMKTPQQIRVVNNGGVIRISENEVFHCCIWQYEAIVLGDTTSIKRPYKDMTQM